MTDSELANDRTFLAWLRTGIALFGLGFVIAKVSLLAKSGTGAISDQALYSGTGVVVVLCGAALIVFGCVQHANLARILGGDEQVPPRWPRRMTAGAVAGALLLSGLIVVTT